MLFSIQLHFIENNELGHNPDVALTVFWCEPKKIVRKRGLKKRKSAMLAKGR